MGASVTASSPASATARSAAHGLRLWPDEYEELRAEARGAVKAGMEMMPLSAPPASITDPAARAKATREMLRARANPEPEGGNREIAGRHCRVFRPENPRDNAGNDALYLHFHGGGMIAGAPEISDA